MLLNRLLIFNGIADSQNSKSCLKKAINCSENLKELIMKNITTIGRILFAIPFALFGINHFLMTDYYLGMLTSFIPPGL